jgi:transcription elongation factor GreA
VTTQAKSGARDLIRGLGLLVDGPARWEAALGSRSPGVFIVELPGGAPSAPIDIVAVRRWIDRVPSLTLEGERPSPQELAKWLHEFWLPDEPVLYVGRSVKSPAARLAAMYATPLGDARPHPGGHWLKTLSALKDLRVWWAETDAHEEYEDALLSEVAERNEGRLPFANLTATDGASKAEALAHSLTTDARSATTSGTTSNKTTKPRAQVTRKAATPRLKGAAAKPAAEPTHLTAEGLERLTTELDNLRTTVRPEVIARVKTAREFGDLKENGDYEYARKEQSFVEGRIQALEALLRNGVVVDDAATKVHDGARLGSRVTVESEGEQITFVLVSSAEANAAAGRISNISPVGQALMGARAGDEVSVRLPAEAILYRVIEVG